MSKRESSLTRSVLSELGPALRFPGSEASRQTLRAGHVQTYYACEVLTGAVIYLAVLFSPWAFGSTQPWSIWTVNLAGYLLAALLMAKSAIRRFTGYNPPRWEGVGLSGTSVDQERTWFTSRKFTATLAVLTAALLAYCLISAANARATFHDETLTFEYHECLQWLPHSFDSTASWFAFWTYLGLAAWFWSVWDWLGGKSTHEGRVRAHSGDLPHQAQSQGARGILPCRLRRILWVLAVSGAFLALEGIIQRLANSPRLLFLVLPRIHQTAETQFGPYAYRSNAAQYLNLLWPVCIGFWWHIQGGHGRRPSRYDSRRSNEDWLLVCAAVMAACPLVSGSRGGAFIMLAMAAAILVVALAQRLSRAAAPGPDTNLPRAPALSICLGSAIGVGLLLGWGGLKPRLADMTMSGRNELSEAARPMAKDFPLFGTGPGTFETVSQLYPRPAVFWPAQLHNDWLETRITFGWLGSCLIGLALGTVLAWWFVTSGRYGGWGFAAMVSLAMAGCLAHARFDFPFQVHSVLLLFVTWCAVLFALSGKRS